MKRELDFGDESEQANQTMTLGPEMFGLKRISEVTSSISRGVSGSSTSNPIALNRRGIVSWINYILQISVKHFIFTVQPARIRKKNPLFFDDDTIVNQSTNKSPRKTAKVYPPTSSSGIQSNQSSAIVASVKTIKRGIEVYEFILYLSI